MPKRDLAKNTPYHIYNRGFNKQLLFFDERDYDKFLLHLESLLKDFPSLSLHAYCILPNHFHLLMQEALTPGAADLVELEPGIHKAHDLSLFMNRLQVSYARFFTVKYGKTIKKGLKLPVFEGRFQAQAVESEEYLAQLMVYIEQNAVKHELVDDPKDWPYSSNSHCQEGLILDDDFFPGFN